MFWDFISLRPETIHQVSFLFSDRGIPDGYRLNGYGSHTFKLVDKDGSCIYCKFRYKVNFLCLSLWSSNCSACGFQFQFLFNNSTSVCKSKKPFLNKYLAFLQSVYLFIYFIVFYAALFRVVLGYYDFNFQVVYLLEIAFRLLERQTDGSTPLL